MQTNTARIALLCLLLAMPATFAFLSTNRIFDTAVDPTGACTANTFGVDWRVLSFAALLLNFAVVAFAWVMSGFFNWPQATSWVREFTYSLMVSALVLVLFISASGMLGSTDFGIGRAKQYAHITQLTISKDFALLTTITAGVSLIGNQAPYLRPGGIIGFSFQLSSVFRPIFDALGMVLNAMVASVGEWYAHQFLLCFAENTMLQLLLPAGLFLRCYGFTKGAGDALIGLSLGFYFIYPLMLNLSADVVNLHFGQPVQAGQPQTSCTSNSYDCYWETSLGQIWQSVRDYVMNENSWFGFGVIILLLKAMGVSMIAAPLLPLVVRATFTSIGIVAYYVIVISIILPVFNIFLTLTFSREVARYLGTEIDLSSIEKLL